MNEQIRKFAKKSGFSLDADDIYTAKLEHLPITENMEKFAELIVRECAGIAYEYDAPKMSGPGMIIAGRIEQHFGVEE